MSTVKTNNLQAVAGGSVVPIAETACRIYASNNGGAYDVQTATIVFHR